MCKRHCFQISTACLVVTMGIMGVVVAPASTAQAAGTDETARSAAAVIAVDQH